MTNIPLTELALISKLSVDGENPNRMTEKQLERLKSSIEKYGFIVPIITNNKYLVADGEQRLTVAKSLGYTHVPVVKLDVEDVDRRLLRQVLNKLRGEHDLIADALEFERIIEMGNEDELKHLLDLNDSQLERYLSEIREIKAEDYEIPEIDKIKTSIQRGDIYKLGNHRLMCGDATKIGDICALSEKDDLFKFDLLLTDPPYGKLVAKGRLTTEGKYAKGAFTGFKNQPKKWVANPKYSPIIGNEKEFDPKPLLLLSDKIIIFGGNYFSHALPNSRCWFVWDKGSEIHHINFADCELIWTNLDKVARIYKCMWRGLLKEGESGKRLHPSQKPVKLISNILKDVTMKDHIILDPYGGSGSTLIACEQTGRRCYMMEIDPRYCQVIVNRWENYTQQKATRLER